MPKRQTRTNHRNHHLVCSNSQALSTSDTSAPNTINVLTMMQIEEMRSLNNRFLHAMNLPLLLTVGIKVTHDTAVKSILARFLIWGILIAALAPVFYTIFPRGIYGPKTTIPSNERINKITNEHEAYEILENLHRSFDQEKIELIKLMLGLLIVTPCFVYMLYYTCASCPKNNVRGIWEILAAITIYLSSAVAASIGLFIHLKYKQSTLSRQITVLNTCTGSEMPAWNNHKDDTSSFHLFLHISNNFTKIVIEGNEVEITSSSFMRELDLVLQNAGWKRLMLGTNTIVVDTHPNISHVDANKIRQQLINNIKNHYYLKENYKRQLTNLVRLMAGVRKCGENEAQSYCYGYTEKTVDVKIYYIAILKRFIPEHLTLEFLNELRELFGDHCMVENTDYIKIQLLSGRPISSDTINSVCTRLKLIPEIKKHEGQAESERDRLSSNTPFWAIAATAAIPTHVEKSPTPQIVTKRKNITADNELNPPKQIINQTLKVSWSEGIMYEESKKENTVFSVRTPFGGRAFLRIDPELRHFLSPQEYERLCGIVRNGGYAAKGHHTKGGHVGTKYTIEKYTNAVTGKECVSTFKVKATGNVRFFAHATAKTTAANGEECTLHTVNGVKRKYHR